MAMTSDEGSEERPASLVFLDPPYGRNLVPRALTHLREVGRIAPNALIVAETGLGETWRPEQSLLAERQHGAAHILIFRVT
jgi:16S rRNA (guanine966-N2)-methyltransferase